MANCLRSCESRSHFDFLIQPRIECTRELITKCIALLTSLFSQEKKELFTPLEMGWQSEMIGNVDNASSRKRSHHVASWISRGWLRWNAGMLRELKRKDRPLNMPIKFAIVLWIMGWGEQSVHRADRVSSVPSESSCLVYLHFYLMPRYYRPNNNPCIFKQRNRIMQTDTRMGKENKASWKFVI